VHRWVESIGLESAFYGTHSMRRTKAAQIYRKTGNLRAVQLLLGHTKLESTVRYLGIEVDDAVNPPPPKGGGFELRLKAGLVGPMGRLVQILKYSCLGPSRKNPKVR
jgi:hypothetical protein